MSTVVASPRGASTSVVVAAVATGVGALPLLIGFSASSVPTGALYGAGWPAFGVAAALLLDRGTEPRVGRTLAVLALVPAVIAAIAVPTAGNLVWTRVEDLWRNADIVVVLLTLVVLAWAMGYAPGRTPRRRLFWLLVWSAVMIGAVVVADSTFESRAEAVVLTLGMWSLAGLVARLTVATELRPVDEPLVDVGAVALTLAIGAAVGVLVRVAGTRAGIPAPDVTAAFAAVTSTALAWPAAAWWRRSLLARRYGTGTLTPADVASITADLHRLTDPRELLAKAAEMVAASSGNSEVTLVLGDDSPDIPPGWIEHRLLVGGDWVGTLLLKPDDPEGPEPRQVRMVEQLLPTVALVCRAVGLAVEAEHARQDVARERDAERTRILGDLHDGLGPVLAGMSMRVQAELRRSPTPLLESLAPELAEARGDLRRIVSGLTPSALHDADLTRALERLIATFNGDGRHVGLEVAVEHPLPGEVTIAVYRCVAEGITNAVRHGRASRVTVRVAATATGQVAVDVRDNGTGGPIASGVGLTSLRQRAEQLGGSLAVGPYDGGGVLLHVELSTVGAA
ncbi:sensor histidine kinase [Kribbella sp. NPDC050124]|uniref:sensor histidine kinase n=1 Tax=Kribbella sp. NPDC050124 TaxID=3364114 RepID=UPI003791D17B